MKLQRDSADSQSLIRVREREVCTVCSGLPVNEPRCEKTGLRGFQPGPTQTQCISGQSANRKRQLTVHPKIVSDM